MINSMKMTCQKQHTTEKLVKIINTKNDQFLLHQANQQTTNQLNENNYRERT
jgi:hypothetical protein